MSDHGVSIGRCAADDIDDVIRFIDAHWKHGHVLARCRTLLDWQHRDADGGYSFVIARRGSAVVGILGYIATRRYDPALGDDSVVWLTMWRALNDKAAPSGLGLALLQHLTRTEPHRAIGAVGLNPDTAPLYHALGYHLGELRHYVRPNPAVSRFQLARVRRPPPRAGDAAMTASPITGEEQFADFDRVFDVPQRTPRKTVRYFFARYARHPVYAYRVIALRDRDTPVGLLATRVAEHDGACALRIVDVLATDATIARAGAVIDALIAEAGAEYADLYNVGIDPGVFARAGFATVDPDGPDIIPDHFEPFEHRNVRLWYAISSGDPVLFKGDADQDRPSI